MKYHKKKIVLIGAGYWGTNIAKNLIKLNIEKLIIYDSNLKNAALLNKRLGFKAEVQKNFKEIIEDKENEYIIFATPPSQNYKLVEFAIKNNKKIFIEKPGFKNIEELKLIKKKYPNKIKNVTFGYIYIFNNYIKFIKKFITDKKNGKILYVKFQRQNLGPIRNDVDVKYDLSSHDISILIYLFGKKLKLINSNSYKILNSKISDISNLSFQIKNFFVDINSSWLNPDKIRRIIIITNKKMLLFDEMNIHEKIKIFNKYAQYPRIDKFNNKFFSKKAQIYQGKNYSPRIKDNDTLYDEIKNFVLDKNRNYRYTNFSFAQYILKILKQLN